MAMGEITVGDLVFAGVIDQSEASCVSTRDYFMRHDKRDKIFTCRAGASFKEMVLDREMGSHITVDMYEAGVCTKHRQIWIGLSDMQLIHIAIGRRRGFVISDLESFFQDGTKKPNDDSKHAFKKGDLVVRDWDKEHEYPMTVGRVLRDIDTQEEFLTYKDDDQEDNILPVRYFVRYDPKAPKAVRKKEIELQIKALEEELNSLG